jgi:uncharacterized protein (TIGR02246 family)
MSPPRTGDVETLYFLLLEKWNARDAAGYAALCTPHGYVIGFDGSELVGRTAIEASLRAIFAHHQTPTFVAKVRSVELFADVAILRAVAGMVPAGRHDLDPNLNAIQTMVASHDSDRWHVEVFHNTPAAFHGRPEAREALTQELRDVLAQRGA